MHPLIEQHQSAIRALCQKHGVKRLDLFGSAARGDFDEKRSDLDFFVEFIDYSAPAIPDQWFGLQEDLERVLQVPVQLVSTRDVTNPLFLDVANSHRVSLYAA
jgi:predicted nucleotidyltransferase